MRYKRGSPCRGYIAAVTALRAGGNSVWDKLLPRATVLIVGATVFWLAYDRGSYGEASRNTAAIALWWVIIIAVALGIWPAARSPRIALVVGGLLACFTLLTLASTVWADSAESALADFNRAALYLAVFLVVVLAGRRNELDWWSDGIAIGVTAIGVLALSSRLFPDLVSRDDARTLLPSASSRLSYPVTYWNALAILIAIAAPLLVRSAVVSSGSLQRALSLAPIPLLASAVYLTSSRGGVATAAVAIGIFVALTARRDRVLIALLCAALGSAVAIAVLLDRHELVNDPASAATEEQGLSAALLLCATAALTGGLYAAVCRWGPSELRLSRLGGRIVAAGTVVLIAAVVVAARPLDRFHTFKQPPQALTSPNPDFVRAHLLSGNGSGRWQFWASAVDEFRSKPLLGRGGGSYEAWWAQHGTLSAFVRNAHSLYLETLGELGAVGLLLLLAVFATGAFAGLIRVSKAAGDERVTMAALASGLAGFIFAAGIDWIWELTAVSVVGFVFLGLLTGPGCAVLERLRVVAEEDAAPRRQRLGFGAGVAVVATAWLFICAHAIPLLAGLKLRASQTAAAGGSLDRAASDALSARSIEPWAASPYSQLALVTERVGALGAARRWIAEAIQRDPTDWRLWLIAARIETKAGEIPAARRSLERARQLNPRSPLFSAPSS